MNIHVISARWNIVGNERPVRFKLQNIAALFQLQFTSFLRAPECFHPLVSLLPKLLSLLLGIHASHGYRLKFRISRHAQIERMEIAFPIDIVRIGPD